MKKLQKKTLKKLSAIGLILSIFATNEVKTQAENEYNLEISPIQEFMKPQSEDHDEQEAYPKGIYYMQAQADQEVQSSENNLENPEMIRRCGTPVPQSTWFDANNPESQDVQLFTTYFNNEPQREEKGAQPRLLGRPMIRNNGPMQQTLQEQVHTAIGDINYQSIALYAQQLQPALANLSENSTPQELQTVQEMVRNIGFALRQLNPQSNQELMSNKIQELKLHAQAPVNKGPYYNPKNKRNQN